jgi:hypothetical protein
LEIGALIGAQLMEHQKIKRTLVVGPLGEPLTIEGLPSPHSTRWVPRRKAEVIAAVEGGLLSLDEACDRYSLTLEEFASWQRSIERAGLAGLRTTQLQRYRDEWERKGC